MLPDDARDIRIVGGKLLRALPAIIACIEQLERVMAPWEKVAIKSPEVEKAIGPAVAALATLSQALEETP